LHFFVIYFGCERRALHMLRQADPRLSQGEPKRFVLIVLGSPSHRDAFLRASAVIKRRPHDTPRGELNDEEISTEDCGGDGIRRGRNSGDARKMKQNGTFAETTNHLA